MRPRGMTLWFLNGSGSADDEYTRQDRFSNKPKIPLDTLQMAVQPLGR